MPPESKIVSGTFGFEGIVGQEQLVSRLREFTYHFRQRGDAPDHILLIGPSGLGQATIANALAGEVGAHAKICDAESLEKRGDLTALLTSLDPRDVFVLKQARALRQTLVEVLIPALSEFKIDLLIGWRAGARVHPYQLNRFTCLACVDKESDISPKIREQFALALRIEAYSRADLSRIATLIAERLGRQIEPSAAALIASASTGSPHQAEVLVRRVGTDDGTHITQAHVQKYLSLVGVGPHIQAWPGAGARLDNLSGVEFEGLVAALLARMGFRVETTRVSGDGGIDIVATFEKPLLGGRYLVQCKRFSPASPVGAPLVREFYGAVRADHKAVKGILITTSSFTDQAKEFADNLPLELIDREALDRLLREHDIEGSPTPTLRPGLF